MKKIMLTACIALATLSTQPAVAQNATALTASEKEHLLLMREEEKLARDVYATLGDKYSPNVFKNIPQSEDRHMSSVASLLQKYGLVDPVKEDTRGVFTNPEMTKLYNELVAAGNNELAALQVGAKIEELDIADLMKAMDDTEKADLDKVYDNLLRGSRNHLRAFMRQIDRLGGTYKPVYISQAQFDEILKGDHEKGNHQGGANRDGKRGKKSDCDKKQDNGQGQGNGQGQKWKMNNG